MSDPLTFAVPKGRILGAIGPILERAGLDPSPLFAEDRRLVRRTPAGDVAYVFLKPDDVPTYVEHGAADVGICGRDTLLERSFDLLVPVDLGVGRCRLVVAGPAWARALVSPDAVGSPTVPRVATKYPRIACDHFARRGIQPEIIPVHGSVELAPLVGLSDVIVDVVETGSTLRDNGLEILDEVAAVSTVFIANRAAFKLRADVIRPLVSHLRAAAS